MPLALAVLLAIATGVARGETPITVSAAASLSDALESVGRAYERAGGGPVRFNFAGSNVLARQIASGAPVDVFVSADEAQMRVARQHGAIDEATLVHLLGNRLAVITPRGRGATLPDVRALGGPSIRRIALGDPAAVPAGVYARTYLERIGIWTAIAPRVVPVGNVRAALSAVETAAADAGIVFESDTVTAREIDVAFVISDASAPAIVYPAAIVSASRNKRAAARFLAFLRSADASAIFRAHKFIPLSR
jgi:molybdate transport system substrate-binding protein